MNRNTVKLSLLSICCLFLASFPSQAQNRPQQPRNNTNTAINNDWSKNVKTETEFMQGCVGQQNLQPAQRNIKQSFCQCAFNAYKTRYTPQLFAQINTLAIQVGQNGPRLVNLMMRPELDRCSTQTNYRP